MTIRRIDVTTGVVTEIPVDAPSYMTTEQELEAERAAAVEEIVQIEERKRLDALRAQAAAELSEARTRPEIEAVLERKRSRDPRPGRTV